MSELTANSATARISRVVRAALAEQGVADCPGPDRDLRQAGLSSLGVVVLMLAIEAEFGIEFRQTDMIPSNFSSIAAIETLVATMVSAR